MPRPQPMPLVQQFKADDMNAVYSVGALTLLHKGSVSSVYLADCCCDVLHQETGPKVLKVYHKTAALQARHWLNISREVTVLTHVKDLSVPGVVQLCCTAEDKNNVYLIFEPCAGGDLYMRLTHAGLLTEQQLAAEGLIPLLKVLASLHELGIIHRDMKPENIFFDADGGLCLGDFGLAINTDTDRPVSRVGTIDYMAPEVLAQPSADQVALHGLIPAQLPAYTSAVDVWSLGVLAYECLTGMTPFLAVNSDLSHLRDHMRKGPTHLRPGMSAACSNFLAQVLIVQPGKRPTALQLLGHPWLRGHMCAQDLKTYASSAADWYPKVVSRIPPMCPSCHHGLQRSDANACILLNAADSSSGPGFKHADHNSKLDSSRSQHLQPTVREQKPQQTKRSRAPAAGRGQPAVQQHRQQQWAQQQSAHKAGPGVGTASGCPVAGCCTEVGCNPAPAVWSGSALPQSRAESLAQEDPDIAAQPVRDDSQPHHPKQSAVKYHHRKVPDEPLSAHHHAMVLPTTPTDHMPAATAAPGCAVAVHSCASSQGCHEPPCSCSAIPATALEESDTKATRDVNSKQHINTHDNDGASKCQHPATRHSSRTPAGGKDVSLLGGPRPAVVSRHHKEAAGVSMWTRVQGICCHLGRIREKGQPILVSS